MWLVETRSKTSALPGCQIKYTDDEHSTVEVNTTFMCNIDPTVLTHHVWQSYR